MERLATLLEVKNYFGYSSLKEFKNDWQHNDHHTTQQHQTLTTVWLRGVYNDLCGDLPTKRDIIWLADLRGSKTPHKTVSGRYLIVDTLINDGYLTNNSTGPVYALRITRKGIEALS